MTRDRRETGRCRRRGAAGPSLSPGGGAACPTRVNQRESGKILENSEEDFLLTMEIRFHFPCSPKLLLHYEEAHPGTTAPTVLTCEGAF